MATLDTINVDVEAYRALKEAVDAGHEEYDRQYDELKAKVTPLIYSFKTVMYSCQGDAPECRAMPATVDSGEMAAHLEKVHGIIDPNDMIGDILDNLGNDADWDG